MDLSGISVIVCCYNSAAVIEGTLEKLAGQKFKTVFPKEVILVNNNCTDDTGGIAEQIWKKNGLAEMPTS